MKTNRIMLLLFFGVFLLQPLQVNAFPMIITDGSYTTTSGGSYEIGGTVEYNWIQGGSMETFGGPPTFILSLNGYEDIDLWSITPVPIFSELLYLQPTGASAWADNNYFFPPLNGTFSYDGTIAFSRPAVPTAEDDWWSFDDVYVGSIDFDFTFYQGGFPIPGLRTLHVKAEAKPVPEPATMILLGTGLLGLIGTSRKKFKK